MPCRHSGSTPSSAAAQRAAANDGVIDHGELLELGLTRRQIDGWLATARLHALHDGVYALGHTAISRRGRWIAALRSARPGAALCGRSGAYHRGLSVREGPATEIWVPVAGRRNRDGVVIHAARLVSEDIELVRGLPVLSLSYLLLQLASSVSTRVLDSLMAEAAHEGLSARQLNGQIERSRGKRGVCALRLAADGYRGDQPTRSVPEADFVLLCQRYRLPAPAVNVPIGDFEVDFFWPEAGLIVEIDGFGPHRGRERFEGDRERAVKLRLSGYEYLPFTPRQLRDRRKWVAQSVESAYRRRLSRSRD